MESRRSDAAIRLSGVTKAFAKHRAVSDLDLHVPRGSVYGLLGPNGSGKTTSIRMIMGILVPDRGSVELLGESPRKSRARVGYLPEERGLYKNMKVLETLVFFAELRGVPVPRARRDAQRWLERLELEAWRDKKIQDLSKGMQQKVQFIGAVLHEPELLILDEPFSGLDPINQNVLEEIVHELRAKGTTILFSTHLMDHAERLCDAVCLISASRKVLDGNLRDLKRSQARGVLALDFDGDDRWIAGPGVVQTEAADVGIHVLLSPDADPMTIMSRGVAAGARFRRFEVVEPSLHEIFVTHAGAENGGADDHLRARGER